MKIKLKISAIFYNALRVVVPKSDVRYYLNGMCIDFEHQRWMATDGHRALIIPWDNDTVEFSNWMGEDPDKLIVSMTSRKMSEYCIIEITRTDITGIEGLQVTATNFSNYNKEMWQEKTNLIDGKFPDMDRVIPKYPEHNGTIPLAAYNPQYVWDVAKELKMSKPAIRVIPSDDANSSALVEFAGFERSALIYVLMPMRWDHD